MDNEQLDRILATTFIDELRRTSTENRKQAESEVINRALQCTLIILSAPDEIKDDISITMLREVLTYIVEPLHKAPQEAPNDTN